MPIDLSGKFTARMLDDPKFKAALEESKRVHMRTFWDVMEPAFADDRIAEVELVGALNLISRGEQSKALRKLSRLKKRCASPDDTCAVEFFSGLAYEMAGMTLPAIQHFFAAASAVPGHYMTHVMLARLLHKSKSVQAALANYMTAIELIDALPTRDEIPAINLTALRGSMLAGAADCSLMMGNYDDAEWALCEAESIGFENPKLDVIYAMLYAATGRKAPARERLAKLRKEHPAIESSVSFDVESVIAGKHPRFAVLKDVLDSVDYDGFWSWFAVEEQRFALMISAGLASSVAAAKELSAKLTELFGNPNTELAVALEPEKDGFAVTVSDNYVLTLSVGMERLLAAQPEELKSRWRFAAIH